MAYFQIPEDPKYTEEIRMFETTDRAHAKLFNGVFQEVIGNIAAIRRQLEQKVLIGPKATPLKPGNLLFVVDEAFRGAAFENMTFGNAPEKVENWGELKEGEGILSGDLSVSKEAPSGSYSWWGDTEQ